ncbi:MAG: GatB/YqeY domain-containing protein [Anaerolineales bacterium]|nr:GatB/YqeY domain-containing protein [Anaerolineales bacterium]
MLTKEQIENDLKDAMRAGDDVRKRTLRMVLSTIKLAEVDRQEELEGGALLGIIQKEVKSRQETIEEAQQIGRDSLVESTQAEIEILEAYLPEALDEQELDNIVSETISETGASGPQDMGRVMKAIMPKVQGRADGKTVSTLVQRKLSAS